MRYSSLQIVFQEVPNEISLALHITGCPLRCTGCHSSDIRNPKVGTVLTAENLNQFLTEYRNYITCVVFLGGEWEPSILIEFLEIIQKRNLKTCLYTGYEYHQVSPEILKHLDYLKYGPYRPELGGLDSPRTNQRFIEVNSGFVLNHYFNGTTSKEEEWSV